jgi:hypothetical protein
VPFLPTGAQGASGVFGPRSRPGLDRVRGQFAMTCDDSAYAAMIRQAVHDAVRALLTAPPESVSGSLALREVTTWLAAEHGAAAVTDLAEELADDLAEAFEALAAAEGRSALAVLDSWLHDVPPPCGPAAPHPPATAGPGEGPRRCEDRELPTRGEAPS